MPEIDALAARLEETDLFAPSKQLDEELFGPPEPADDFEDVDLFAAPPVRPPPPPLPESPPSASPAPVPAPIPAPAPAPARATTPPVEPAAAALLACQPPAAGRFVEAADPFASDFDDGPARRYAPVDPLDVNVYQHDAPVGRDPFVSADPPILKSVSSKNIGAAITAMNWFSGSAGSKAAKRTVNVDGEMLIRPRAYEHEAPAASPSVTFLTDMFSPRGGGDDAVISDEAPCIRCGAAWEHGSVVEFRSGSVRCVNCGAAYCPRCAEGATEPSRDTFFYEDARTCRGAACMLPDPSISMERSGYWDRRLGPPPPGRVPDEDDVPPVDDLGREVVTLTL